MKSEYKSLMDCLSEINVEDLNISSTFIGVYDTESKITSKVNLGNFIKFIQTQKVNKPTIVCLCGSTKFKDTFAKVMRDETLLGKIVLTVGLFGHIEGLDMTSETKVMLDELHKRKIDLADEILVLNVDGYIGSSTRSEIEYADTQHKLIRFLETPK